MENPMKLDDDWGYPMVQETSIWYERVLYYHYDVFYCHMNNNVL